MASNLAITFQVSKTPKEPRTVKHKNGDEELIIYCTQEELNDALMEAAKHLKAVDSRVLSQSD